MLLIERYAPNIVHQTLCTLVLADNLFGMIQQALTDDITDTIMARAQCLHSIGFIDFKEIFFATFQFVFR